MTGAEIKTERLRRELSQEAAARQIDVTVTTWARWERDERAPTGLYAEALEAWMDGRE